MESIALSSRSSLRWHCGPWTVSCAVLSCSQKRRRLSAVFNILRDSFLRQNIHGESVAPQSQFTALVVSISTLPKGTKSRKVISWVQATRLPLHASPATSWSSQQESPTGSLYIFDIKTHPTMIISRPILIIVINESFTWFQKQYMMDDLISNNRFSGFGQSTGLQRNHYLDDRVNFNQYQNQNDPSKLNQLEDLHDLLDHQL